MFFVKSEYVIVV